MNHLAHLFLAPDSPEARIGSVLGDFVRGVDLSTYPGEVVRGVHHHRAVDSFTDSHPAVLDSKGLFSKRRRRFAGVALDILYDHFLLRHWSRFSEKNRDTFIQQVYGEFADYEHLMSATMVQTTRRMVAHDWFGAYQSLDNIGHALDRVASRIRFANRFDGIIEEIYQHEEELEARFLNFFPELHTFAGEHHG
ncbi:Acyl carrier protein phosphodiesterase [Marinobacter persicus]|uniref:Acyl carrier protein phosphodiesterase n=1 Tax=Marinobacter persicus TaxID=930118 RepID=A0A1I3VN35_9GAMM|nr:ACP phosphodiesterase [Marinobacter persicus]GHD50628.1 ACP phosphodiesterase [Marinobacter persicus]SFJ96403.1 Acyl carrier protein phosphodiesterase [Marinobacter persicus]